MARQPSPAACRRSMCQIVPQMKRIAYDHSVFTEVATLMRSDKQESRRYLVARLAWFLAFTCVVLLPLVLYLIVEDVKFEGGGWICVLTTVAMLVGLAYCLSGLVWSGGLYSRWRAFRDGHRAAPQTNIEEEVAIADVSNKETVDGDANQVATAAENHRPPLGFRFRLVTVLVVAAVAPFFISVFYRLLVEHGKAAAVPTAILLGAWLVSLAFSLYGLIVTGPRDRRRRGIRRHVVFPEQEVSSLDTSISPEVRVEQLEADLARARLLINSLLEACLRKKLVTPEELRAALHDIDKMDGSLDGKLSPAVVRPAEPPNE